ncbi:MAG: O-methyltransferase [Lachnospiraceae bacterium]|nr:O-methyltransferase [Lachnospiraceae bacterium]
MIVSERYLTYLASLEQEENPVLAQIEQEALEAFVPIIRKDTQHFMKLLMQMLQPEKILEVGAAVGFSALLMAYYNPKPCHITTIENYEPRIPIARENFRRAGMEERIRLLEGDAIEILPTLQDPYDFIFMDAAKGQYPAFLPYLKERMHSGSVLVTDNILQEGDLLESHYAIERRDRTIHKRMREYLRLLTQDEDFVCSILPVGDGLAVCTMK